MPRIIITGTGRAGTTFLVQLFAALDFDTGFSLEQSLGGVDELSHAGLEHRPVDAADNPYVIKSPWYVDELPEALTSGTVRVRAAIVPVRDLTGASESRRRVYREAAAMGLDPLNHPGSLWHVTDGAKQATRLTTQFYELVRTLVHHDVPLVLMDFPRLVLNGPYLFQTLEPLMRGHGVSPRKFLAAHVRVAHPEWLHAFDRPAFPAAGAAMQTG